ncbi:type II secretion system protein, partial [bacterium]|nr:type II secretion system protein [bacterium]
ENPDLHHCPPPVEHLARILSWFNSSLRRSRRQLKQSSFCLINGLPCPHFIRPRNDKLCAKHTVKNLSTYRLNVSKTDKTPHPSPVLDLLHAHRVSPKLLRNKRLNLFAIRTRFTPSVRKSALPWRGDKVTFPLPLGEGKKWAFTLAEIFSPCRKVKFSFGFTLAETLITLGIIGIVAALTIPQLVSNYKKHVTVNKLKYVYSLLKNAEQTAIKQASWKIPDNYPIKL